MSADMGDGDLVDPELADLDTMNPAVDAEPQPPADDDGVDGDGLDDVPERASEIDDVTASIPRPTALDALEAAEAERDEFRALAQRVQADFDNYRKRAATQSAAEAERATGRLAEALLPVLDAAESAYVEHPDEVGPLLNQMLAELKKHGLEPLDLDGQPFDPEIAEAVAHEPGEGGEPYVAEVLRSGYRWKGRTLRAAMVKTSD